MKKRRGTIASNFGGNGIAPIHQSELFVVFDFVGILSLKENLSGIDCQLVSKFRIFLVLGHFFGMWLSRSVGQDQFHPFCFCFLFFFWIVFGWFVFSSSRILLVIQIDRSVARNDGIEQLLVQRPQFVPLEHQNILGRSLHVDVFLESLHSKTSSNES